MGQARPSRAYQIALRERSLASGAAASGRVLYALFVVVDSVYAGGHLLPALLASPLC
jgi:hypothetical protein